MVVPLLLLLCTLIGGQGNEGVVVVVAAVVGNLHELLVTMGSCKENGSLFLWFVSFLF